MVTHREEAWNALRAPWLLRPHVRHAFRNVCAGCGLTNRDIIETRFLFCDADAVALGRALQEHRS